MSINSRNDHLTGNKKHKNTLESTEIHEFGVRHDKYKNKDHFIQKIILKNITEDKKKLLPKKTENKNLPLSRPQHNCHPDLGPEIPRNKTSGIRKSHKKLIEKYQNILGIDLKLFDGSIETFKSTISLKS